ncbi:MAG: septal ring lytic transglycosylase RlpA family protein [bacterium]
MNKSILVSWISFVIVAVIAMAAMTAGARHPTDPHDITISYNGYSWTVTTQAQDVAELLLENFDEYAGWQINPGPATRLTDNLTVTVVDTTASPLAKSVATNLAAAVKQAEAPPPKPKPQIHSGWATWYNFGDQLTAASREFPKGTKLRVAAVNSGKTVDVVINDYGPQAWTGMALDLNRPAFAKLAPIGAGRIQVKYYKL